MRSGVGLANEVYKRRSHSRLTMRAKITKIDRPKYSRNGDTVFYRVYFELESGAWAHTDLVSTYRNFERWRSILKSGVGTKIDGVNLKRGYNNKVDADSFIRMIQETLLSTKPVGQIKLL